MKTVFSDIGIFFMKIGRSWDCLIFIMGIPILVRRRHLYWDTHLNPLAHPWSWGKIYIERVQNLTKIPPSLLSFCIEYHVILNVIHGDVIKWKLFGVLAFCAGNSPVTDEFPAKGQWRGALIFSLICVWNNSGVDNGDAGDLRRSLWRYCNVMRKD